jgi:hypothetical protein
MIAVKDAEWYWGSLSSSGADNALAGKDEGTFLVRISTTHADYPFALSFSNGPHSPPSHHRIGKLPLGMSKCVNENEGKKKRLWRLRSFANDIVDEGGYSYFCGELESESLCGLVDLLAEEFDLISPCSKETSKGLSNYQNDPLQKA